MMKIVMDCYWKLEGAFLLLGVRPFGTESLLVG